MKTLRRLVVGLVVAGAMALAILAFAWLAPGPSEKSTRLKVEEGSTVSALARRLERAGLVTSAKRFRLTARIMGGSAPIQAGEFNIPAHASAARILKILQHGHPVAQLLTIPEGMPSILVQERLEAIKDLIGPAPLPEEGSVLPNSYDWKAGESRAEVLKRMQAAMDRTLDKLWAARKLDCPLKTPRDAVILASIVEKETGKASERRMVAGVYCNRLKIGMKLDADPTVIYPITKGKPLGRRIRKSELNAITGYNTYREAGLPEGPIANPGEESIAAVLDPAQTRALYFVADGTGGHVFADTYAEHQANVEKWYAIRRARGEM